MPHQDQSSAQTLLTAVICSGPWKFFFFVFFLSSDAIKMKQYFKSFFWTCSFCSDQKELVITNSIIKTPYWLLGSCLRRCEFTLLITYTDRFFSPYNFSLIFPSWPLFWYKTFITTAVISEIRLRQSSQRGACLLKQEKRGASVKL